LDSDEPQGTDAKTSPSALSNARGAEIDKAADDCDRDDTQDNRKAGRLRGRYNIRRNASDDGQLKWPDIDRGVHLTERPSLKSLRSERSEAWFTVATLASELVRRTCEPMPAKASGPLPRHQPS
jgi:hypothetical protein